MTRFTAWLLASVACSGAFAAEPGRRTLTFENRVEAQAAIERVYYTYQIGTTKAFEKAVMRAVLESKVRKSLDQTAALETYWKTAVTDEMLQRELERMTHGSRMPQRLLELYAALGNDPFVVKECLARAVLVDRLTRNFFAFDAKIHAQARARAEELHRRLEAGELDPRTEHPDRTVFDLTMSEAEASKPTSNRLAPDEFRKQRAQLPNVAGQVSTLKEERDAFMFSVVLDETANGVRAASYVVPKITWDIWWETAKRSLHAEPIAAVATEGGALPLPAKAIPASGSTCVADDTWDNGVLDEVPDSRAFHTAVWTGSLMIVWGGYVYDGSPHYFNTGGRYDPATDSWTPTSLTGAPSARTDHSAVWTGSLMVVWGGGSVAYATTGGRYDPVTDTWTPISTMGAPPFRQYQSAVWTGSLMIVWGGEGAVIHNSGGRYDPVTDHWSPTAMTDAPTPREGHSAVWTGTEMIIWGGLRPNVGSYNTGGRYNPLSNTWIATKTLGAPSPRWGHAAVWTGSRMVVWGGPYTSTGGRYDPANDSWTPTSTADAPSGREHHTAVWTGTEMVIWGGQGALNSPFNTGGRYDPAIDSWTPTSTMGGPSARHWHSALWTGSVMIVWGGSSGAGPDLPLNTGGRYDPTTDGWTPTATSGAPRARNRHTAVWTGSVMVVWGGVGYGGYLNTGGRYDPALDTWSPTSVTGAPSARNLHTALWTGSTMVVWGGAGSGGVLNTGGRYDPAIDAWTATSTTGAPSARSRHIAVSTGSRMLVWGGAGAGSYLNTGGRYDPVTDQWTPTSTTGAPTTPPSAAVWSGSLMVVWGGDDGTGFANTGARYNPETDIWTPTSMAGAPTERSRHSAAWSGDVMVVWGGYGLPDDFGDVGPLNTGGRYDPMTDTWSPTSTMGAPSARSRHTAVSSGSQMLVWGGNDDGGYVRTGGRYEPSTDLWTPTSTASAPGARSDHAAVWTGDMMIVWGGTGDGGYTQSGGRYVLGATVDDDGDGYTECQGDCSDANPNVHPNAVETCNAIDDNCNGQLDEDVAGVDSDGDGVRNACDNCTLDYNPSESDFDHDGQGDLCDLDDGLIYVYASGKNYREWQPESSYTTWNSYRGSLAVLRATGQYTQAPGSNPLAGRDCGLVTPLVFDPLEPDPGEVAFHLVTGVTSGVESSLGTDSAGSPRPNSIPCP